MNRRLAVILIALSFSTLAHAGQANFVSVATIPGGCPSSSCYGMVAADFNGDGITDIVVTSFNEQQYEAYILLGKGNGEFAPPVGIAPVTSGSSTAFGVITEDFNGDSRLDLAIAESDGSLTVLLGNGDGTFQAPSRYATGLTQAQNGGYFPVLAAGDVTGNKKLDLVLAGADASSQQPAIALLIGNGDGTFSPPIDFAIPVGFTYGLGLALGDMNNDGKADVVVADGNVVLVLLSEGNGTFKNVGAFKPGITGGPPIVLGDFNHDGRLDVAQGGSGGIGVMLGNGDGTLGIAAIFGSDIAGSQIITAADMNGDGNLDLVVASDCAVNILLGNGGGGFQNPLNYVPNTADRGYCESLAMGIGDFNADKKLDIAIAFPRDASSISLLLNLGGAQMQAPEAVLSHPANTFNDQPNSVVLADFNKDGKLDMAMTFSQYGGGDYVDVQLGNGNGDFGAATAYALPSIFSDGRPEAIVAGDFNGDSNLDLTVVDGTGEVDFLAGHGDGTFEAATQVFNGGFLALAAGDLNGDGKLDLVTLGNDSSNNPCAIVLLGNGDGTFQPPVYYVVGSLPFTTEGIAIADFNNDSKPDIAVTDNADGTVTVLINEGNGAFTALSPISLSGAGPSGIATSDFNRDGNLDLAVSDVVGVDVLLGNGNGTFQSPVHYATVTGGGYAVATGDFNGDGLADLAVANGFENTVSILAGKGNGTFSTAVNFFAGTSPIGLAVAELNGDGAPDLTVVDSRIGNYVTVLLNTSAATLSLSSLLPPSKIAGGSSFTLAVNGSNFDSTSVVNWNGASLATTFVSGALVNAIVPASDIANAGTAPVNVYNASTGQTSNVLTFTINNPIPTLISMSPTSAIAGGAGFTLTVNGTNFVSTSAVRWNGSARTTTFLSSTQISASISGSDIATGGTAPVTVKNMAPGGGTTSALTFTINNPVPTISSLSPSSQTAGSASFTLTATGTNFVSGSVVDWNGSARTTTFQSSTMVTAAINAADVATAGAYPVTVTNPAPGGGTSNSLTFTVNNSRPTITSLSPGSATAGGPLFRLTVNGTNYVNTSVMNWNGAALTTTFVSGTKVTASVPASDIAAAGTFKVTVSNPAPGGGNSSPATFTVNNPVPKATSLSPSSALAGGASFTLTVNGSNFVSTSSVEWNGAKLATTFVSSIQLTASVRATDIKTAGSAQVTVVNPAPGGGMSNALTFNINNPVPALTNLQPPNATHGGAAFSLTVSGTGFVSTSQVLWNGSPRTTTYASGTSIKAAIKAADIATAGTAQVTVRNPAPGGGISNSLTFTIK